MFELKTKQAINDKFQGIVATYLTGIVINHIKKGLLPSLPVKKNKIGEYLTSYKQQDDCHHTTKRWKNSPDILGLARNS